MIKKCLLILLLFISAYAEAQTYTLRRTVWSEDFIDSLYLKSTSTPDSNWRKVNGEYVFAFKEKVTNYFPYNQISGTPAGAIADWADITNKPTISGSNTGDNAVNTLYSGLAVSKQNTITPGTTAQYLKGDFTLGTYSGYSINVQALTSSPADAQTIYFGMLPKAPTTTANISKIYIRQSGTIKRAEIYCYSGTAGTNEAWVMSIRLNNTTDTQIASVSASTSERVFSNTGLSIAVSAGDYIEIKCVNPTWATNPLTTIFGGYIYIE